MELIGAGRRSLVSPHGLAAMNDTDEIPEPDAADTRASSDGPGMDVIPLDRECIAARLRRDRRRAVWPLIGLGCFLLIQIGFLAPKIWLIGQRFSMDEALKSDLRSATLVTSLVWAGIVVTMILAAVWHRRRISKVIAAIEDETRSPADICPHCAGTPFQTPPCCARFPAEWSKPDLGRFWHDQVSLGPRASRISRGTPPTMFWKSPPAQLAGRLLGSRSNRVRDRTIKYVTLGTACIATIILARGQTFVSAAQVMIALVWLFLLGGEVISNRKAARRDRADTLPRCLKCDQQIDPGMGRCPECGTTARMGTVHYAGARGDRRVSIQFVLPVVFIAAMLSLVFFASDAIRFITGRLPNAALVALAPYDDDVFHPIWSEVIVRSLDDGQSDRIFEMLAGRMEAGADVNSWHPGLTAIAQGTWPNGLDPKQIDRIHAASWHAEVEAPTTISVGEPFDVRLVGDRRGEILPFMQYMYILYDGVSIDDGPFTRPDDSMVWTLVAEQGSGGALTTNEGGRFQRRISIEVPGSHRVRLAYRLVVGPGSLVDATIDRDELGQSLPPATAAWSRRFEIEHRIDVTD